MTDGHSECPQRITAIEDQLKALGVYDFLLYHEAPLVEREDLLRVHTEGHVNGIFACAQNQGLDRRVGAQPHRAAGLHHVDALLRVPRVASQRDAPRVGGVDGLEV
ncbi:MAG: hypothetical protein ACWGPN_01435, partial [Gammaproteobacteria bacterium]